MPNSDTPHSNNCPLVAVDRRLEDVHQHWHQAEQAYFDPERFRIAIQTAIQTLRTVTFILQKHKKQIPNFDDWYAGWRKRLKEDPLMRWMVDARNKIEKQGDLEANSFIRAEIIASYLNEGPNVEVSAKLFETPNELLKGIPKGEILKHIRENGALKIQRRWVENTLPENELLDAVAIAYGRIAELVHDAHRQLGLETPTTTDTVTGEQYGDGARGGRMPCMIGHEDARSFVVSLTDGRPIRFELVQRDISAVDAKAVKERYGDVHKEMFGGPGANEEEIGANLFDTARSVFLIDGCHTSVFFLFRQRKLVRLIHHEPEDQRDKYLFIRELANEVVRLDADAVMTISESWIAPADPKQPYLRPADSPDRKEQLSGTMVWKNGESIQLSAEIRRTEDKLELGETITSHDQATFLFAPVYEVWGRPIPDKWLKAVESLHSNRDQTTK